MDASKGSGEKEQLLHTLKVVRNVRQADDTSGPWAADGSVSARLEAALELEDPLQYRKPVHDHGAVEREVLRDGLFMEKLLLEGRQRVVQKGVALETGVWAGE